MARSGGLVLRNKEELFAEKSVPQGSGSEPKEGPPIVVGGGAVLVLAACSLGLLMNNYNPVERWEPDPRCRALVSAA